MRNPNGYGSVTKLSGKRRKPYIVRISGDMQWDDNKQDFVRPRTVLGYCSTRKEAMQLLATYNENPYDVDANKATFDYCYELYKATDAFKQLRPATARNKASAYKYLEPIKDIEIKKIKTDTIRKIINGCDHGHATKSLIRSICIDTFKMAMENDIVDKNYAEFISIEKTDTVLERVLFTTQEIQELWDNSNRYDVAIILILLYTGLRVNEFLKNVKDNVNLEEKYIYVPLELAKNKQSVRYVPIHNKILPLVKKFYDRSTSFIATREDGSKIIYSYFLSNNFNQMRSGFGWKQHTMHDTRHTFISKWSQMGLNEHMLKAVVGHCEIGTTRKVYTHIDLADTAAELNKLDY